MSRPGLAPGETRDGPTTAGGPDFAPPPEFDGYRLVSRIGAGAAGQVYLAYDALLDRPTAIKFIDAASQGFSRERFLVEARALARLQHPNVAGIYRVGEIDGHPFIVSEFVRGKSLDQLAPPLPPAEVQRIALDLARGLAAAHRRGVLHRDLKPANAVLADGGEAKLVDFGLAKLIDGEAAPEASMQAPEEPGVTQAGGWLGTPAYMAPEIWRGAPATFRSDLYSLGALLYQLCAGRPPHHGETLDALRGAVLMHDAPPLPARGGGLEPLIHRCLERDPQERFSSADALCQALESLAPGRQNAPPPSGNPYRGLNAFGAEHRALFFGRDGDIHAVLDRLRAERMVLVAGTSGVGKSSLCRAGVLPAIAEGALGEGRWTTISFAPGRHPVQALAAALAPFLDADEAALAWTIKSQWAEVERKLRQRHRDGRPLAIFIDQLEELVTLSDPDEARAIGEVIDAFSSSPGAGPRLLATCRGDFIARIASLPAMGDLTRPLYLLRPLSPEGVREAVEGPARLREVFFESDALVDTLVGAAKVEGALPLLQFALAELWEARDVEQQLIPHAALDSLGGVEGALARHGDAVLERLLPAQRLAARRILSRLVTLEGTRARRTDEELGADAPEVQAALRALVNGRLLVASEAADGSAYEVAHEALIRSWPTLQRWLEEDQEKRALRERLDTAVAEWERAKRPRDLLLRARQLAELEGLDREELHLSGRAFLIASERAARRRRIAAIAMAVLVLALIAGSYLFVRLRERQALGARIAAQVTQGRSALDEARAEEARTSRAEVKALQEFDRGALDSAEIEWRKVRAAQAEIDARYAAAAQAFEAALTLGPSRDAREGLADVLLARALLADAAHRSARRDELTARLALYDDGPRLARLRAPASLSVRTDPDGAVLELARYRDDFSLAPAEPLGASPLQAHALPPGSYLLIARAPGRPEVRLPLLLGRGETRDVSLPIPTRVPDGFVYVPPGRFLFGSAGDDDLRQGFFHTAPLHPVDTAGYLIARHETTFGEWIAFLDALPRKLREKHLPHVGAGGFRGGLGLSRRGGTWWLDFAPGSKHFHLRLGEPLRYPGRNGAPIDWARLPVSGIAAADAQAYVDWLRAHGLGGARLCSELEWERAARGADGRSFPEGEALTKDEADFDETYAGPQAQGPDEVGRHPRSDSPFGVADLVGNVWEWTRSFAEPGSYIARGGSFAFGRNSAQSANREKVEPDLRDVALGMRVCADAPR